MPSQEPLQELIRRAQQHDPAAFDQLVDRFSGPLYGLFCRLAGSTHDAEDLLQELFLRVVRMVDSYKHDGRFEAWLYRIAINLVRDHLRRLRRHGGAAEATGQSPDNWARLEAHPARQPPPDQPAQLAEQIDRLRLALLQLPDQQREVIMLRHFSNMSFQDIADIMGTPLGTALARAHRGLAQLRRLMEAHERP